MSEENSKEKTRGWLLPDSKTPERGGALAPGLYLVATPIGNLKDISLRALDTLAAVDAVLCEDTRVSGKLLKAYGISKALNVYNDHSDEKARRKICARIEAGESLALISDAGMPLISDPGYKLVQDVRVAGLNVTSVPGANAPLTALQLSALPSDAFSFIGFLPPKSAARRSVLAKWKDVPGTLIAFETAPRLVQALDDIEAALGARRVAVARELTKLYEEVRCAAPVELKAHYEAHGLPKGEIVLVIEPPGEKDYTDDEIAALLREALQTMGTKQAAEEIAKQTGRAKKELYNLALKIGKP